MVEARFEAIAVSAQLSLSRAPIGHQKTFEIDRILVLVFSNVNIFYQRTGGK
jgi:hypothetical protein